MTTQVVPIYDDQDIKDRVRIRAAIREKNISMTLLGEMVGISQQRVSNILTLTISPIPARLRQLLFQVLELEDDVSRIPEA